MVDSTSTDSKYEVQHRWAFRLTAILFICMVLIQQGPSQQANFVPSPVWNVISILISPLFGPSYWTVRKYLDKYSSGQLKIFENKFFSLISFFGFLIYLGLSSLPAYFMLAQVLASAVTSEFYTTVEKDISGTKAFSSGTSRAYNRYYIKTPDLAKGSYEKIYITYDEFSSINNKVRMHVSLRKSILGTAIESYSFTPSGQD